MPVALLHMTALLALMLLCKLIFWPEAPFGNWAVVGAALLGGLGAMMTPVASASASGFGLLIIGVLLLLVLVELRRFRQTPPQVTASDS